MRDLLHELAAEHFGLDTKVARTLVALVLHPGRLTLEFLAGRRVRYLPPLRLYLSLSVIYFLASAIAPGNGSTNGIGGVHAGTSATAKNGNKNVTTDTTVGGLDAVSAALDSAGVTSRATNDILVDTLHGNPVIRFFKRRSVERLSYMKAHRSEAVQQISERFHHELPDALFLLVPGLAFGLLLLYHGSGWYYSQHLVFALHFQAFAFAALTVGLIPYISNLADIAIIVYLFIALHRVYRRSAAATAGRLVVVVIGYGVSLALVMAVVGATAFLAS